MKTTRIYALLVILIIFGGKAFGQEHEQMLPKSMIKIGINAFLTQEVKSSDKAAAVNSYPFIGGGLEVSYYHRLPYHFGVNVGFGAQFQPSVFDNTGDSEVKDIYTLYTPMICIPFSIEKAFPAVKTKHGFLLVGELGGRLYKPYKSTYEYTMMYGLDENGICLPDGYIIDYLVLDDPISVSCFAKIGLERPTHKGNMLRFNLLYDYSFRKIGVGEIWKGCEPDTHYGTLSQRFSYVGVEFNYGFRIR